MKDKHQQILQELGLPKTLSHLINGELSATAERTLYAIDPSTQETIATIPVATKDEIDTAVESARVAQKKWRATSPGKRRKAIANFVRALKEREKVFPKLEALESGVPQNFSKQFSSKSLVRNIEYYAEWIDKVYGNVIPSHASSDALNMTMYEPVGVVACIIPWNTPCLFLGSKTGPALAAGCAVIIKPSELASLPASFYAEAAVEAGLPAGLVQVLFGDGEVGQALTTHPGIDKVAFTGGTRTAKTIMSQAGDTLKRLQLELGGKSPHILFEDADTSRSTMMATFGMFGLSGQMCAAGSRLFLHSKIAKEFLGGLVGFAGSLKVGDPMEPDTMNGPLITRAHLEHIEKAVEEAIAAGAEVHCGGKRPDISNGGDGNFYEPTVLTNVDPKSPIAQEELFGPVLCVFEFENEGDVIEMANDSCFGLSAGLWTQDVSRALRVASKLEAGNVWINSYGNLPLQSPFGGVKQSGFGRDGGKEGIMEYLVPKNVYIQI